MSDILALRPAAEAKFGPIRTEHVFPPIPDRRFDWSAVFDNYEPDCPMGIGQTEADAIEDLLALVEDDLCELESSEADAQAARWDHARDLRKHFC